MSRKIVAFGHRKRVGKNTAAEMLSELLLDRGIQIVSFASQLKAVCAQLYGWDGLQSEAYYETHPDMRDLPLHTVCKSPRTIWIEVGNKLREVHPGTWVDLLFESTGDADLIITDLRYPNEAQAVHDRGGICVKISRPDLPNTDDVADCALEYFGQWDGWLQNKGTFLEFRQAIADSVCMSYFEE